MDGMVDFKKLRKRYNSMASNSIKDGNLREFEGFQKKFCDHKQENIKNDMNIPQTPLRNLNIYKKRERLAEMSDVFRNFAFMKQIIITILIMYITWIFFSVFNSCIIKIKLAIDFNC